MLYNLYQIWRIYNIILQIHGFYIAFSFICWSFNYTYSFVNYFFSIFYEDKSIKQLEDKKFE